MFLPAVFFDRDGTLNIDPGYFSDPEKLELYSGVPEGIALLKSLGFKVIVISNQSGIARGYFTSEVVDNIHHKINELLSNYNTGIDAFYYCPYHPDFNTQEECECRKPSPKLVLDAAADHNIDLTLSYFVGDSISDILCGKNAGLKTILVKNTISDEKISSLINQGKIPNFIAENFKDVCDFIKNDFCGGN
jgi:D,D-heptose 1,7-bisphosphate phosphatase